MQEKKLHCSKISEALKKKKVVITLMAYFNPFIPTGKANSHKDYEVKGSTVARVFNAFGALSAIILCNSSGMLPEIQVSNSVLLPSYRHIGPLVQ